MSKYSLMVHGGAGLIADEKEYKESIEAVLTSGKALLESGASALDVVEACVTLLEDDPRFNAGRGSVLNEDGLVDLDAAIMDGRNLNAGSVAGVRRVKNPIRLARRVMESSPHVMLIGDGAMQFAGTEGFELMADEYFIVESRIKQLKEAKEKGQIVLDHSSVNPDEKKLGTVGAVAYDKEGNLAAATSTGGIVNKRFGRVGDTPIIGAGVYADNDTCAVSATGFGEQFIRTVLAKTVADIIYYERCTANEAAKKGIEYLVKKVNGLGGVIVIDSKGNMGSAFSTPAMIRGELSEGGGFRYTSQAQ